MKYSIVLQSFGREQEYRRAVFCLLSHSCYTKSDSIEKVILFTDNPDYFKHYLGGIAVHYVLLTDEKIKLMRGEINFLHRMKIAMIDEAFQIGNGNLLYVDSDTFFMESTEQMMAELSPSISFMHQHEYQFSTLKDMPLPAGVPFRAFYDLITSKEFMLSSGSTLKVTPELSSWNAGAMAFHQTHRQLLNDVYILTDQFYPSTQNHASEQYAFSIVLQSQTQLKSLDKIIYHYWYRIKKIIMDEILEEEINANFLLMSEKEKMNRITALTKRLPYLLETHILTLRDSAIQAFHENKFRIGYRFAFRALLKDPLDNKFWLDLGYHTRRWLKNSFL